jgi:NADH dehydrogenase
MADQSTDSIDIAVLGGGFAGVYCARRLEKMLGRDSRLRVTLISAENHMVFQPMLPEVVGGSISPRHVVNPLRLLCRRTVVYKGDVRRIDWKSRTLHFNAGDFSGTLELKFGHLVLALGAVVDLSRIPGMPEHAFLMRNVGDAMLLRATIISRLEEANLQRQSAVKKRLLTFVVVGGGYSGVETAAQIADLYRGVHQYYPNVRREDFNVYLVHSQGILLPTLRKKLSMYAARELGKLGVKLILNQRVNAVTASRVFLEDGSCLETHTVICTVGNSPHPLVTALCQENGFETEKGRVLVSPTCQVKGQDRLWAAGDCAAVPFVQGGFCPDTAQFAMREGILIGENLTRSFGGKALRNFDFKGLGELASLGHRRAAGEIMGFAFSGFTAWWIWRTVYLMKLPRLDRKVRVVLDWTLDLFFPRDINVLNPRYSTLLKEIHLEKQDVLFRAGEPAFSLYIVKQGRIEILEDDVVIQTLTAGDYFGERELLGSGVWTFSARAGEPSTLVSIPASIFHQIVDGSGSLGKLFQKSASRYQSREMIESMISRIPEEVRNKTAGELMETNVQVLKPTMTVREALLVTRNFPHTAYPLVDGSGKVLGVVNREDFYDFLKQEETSGDTRLETFPPATIPFTSPGVHVDQLLEQLIRSGTSKLLVLDGDGHLLGIITMMDLITAVQDSARGRATEAHQAA